MEKMEAQLASILINTYNRDSALRGQAEEALKLFLSSPGSLSALITLVSNQNQSVPRELRQATGIVLKNRLRDYWTDEGKGLPSTEQEKEYLKIVLVESLLVETDKSLRGIIAESIRITSEFEFPDRFASII